MTVSKTDLRRHMRKCRGAIGPEHRQIAGLFLSHAVSRRWPRETLAAYVATPQEVPTLPVLQQYWQQGQGLWLPLVQETHLLWCWVEKLQQLRPGFRGILEPDPGQCTGQDFPHSATVMLVPGLGFTPSGARLGQGGGFYDRVIPACQAKGIHIVGLAFSVQICEYIPMQEHDACVDEVLICDAE